MIDMRLPLELNETQTAHLRLAVRKLQAADKLDKNEGRTIGYRYSRGKEILALLDEHAARLNDAWHDENPQGDEGEAIRLPARLVRS